MYLPNHFREDRLEVQHALIRSHSLGLLICDGPQGLTANPIPFLVQSDGGPLGLLRAHMARANNQWRELADAGQCLVVFQGPQAYVSPSWYPSKRETEKVVPTWNYATVHVWGQPRVIEEPVWLRKQVGELTDCHEAAFDEPWRVEDAPEDFIAAQLRGIVGLEIPIGRIEGKWKVSQNRSEPDRCGVVEGLQRLGVSGAPMASLVEAKGPAKL